MSDSYEQCLKDLARSFKNLNGQLLGFLLLAIGFLFSSDVIMTSAALALVPGVLAFALFAWMISLFLFFSAEWHLAETKQSPFRLFDAVDTGRLSLGVGSVLLSWALTYIATYVASLQAGEPTILSVTMGGIIAIVTAYFVGNFYKSVIKIPPPPEDSNG